MDNQVAIKPSPRRISLQNSELCVSVTDPMNFTIPIFGIDNNKSFIQEEDFPDNNNISDLNQNTSCHAGSSCENGVRSCPEPDLVSDPELFVVPKIKVTRPSFANPCLDGGGEGGHSSSSSTASVSGDGSLGVIKLSLRSFKGLLYSVLSSIFFSLTAVIVAYLKDIHPGQLACFRFLGILLFTIPMIITARVNPFGPRNKRHFLLLRGLAGATSLYLRYSALHFLPIANATVIVLSMPVFVCIFARIFLKEPCGLFHLITIGTTLFGIGLTSKLDVILGLTESFGVDTSKEMWGLIYSMGATLVGSSVYIFVRKVKECHDSVILFNFSIVAIVETSIITAISDGFKLPETGIAPWLLMILAVLSFYAQLLLTRALQLEEASLVSVTRASSEVICAFLFQIFIFRQLPDVYAVIGAILVTSSVLLTSARKWVITLPQEHLGRKLLGFTLK